jgi:prolyl 4-hydroxylase
MPCGPRLFTFFLYLNDVEEGGHTNFTKLGFSVAPKAGRALLWPSVRNDDPTRKDPRTEHEASPVLRGEKFAANAWLHMYDFKTPFKVGCTG